MAELTGDSPHVIAYNLLIGMAVSEGKTIQNGIVIADRKWLLANYENCANVVGNWGKALNARV